MARRKRKKEKSKSLLNQGRRDFLKTAGKSSLALGALVITGVNVVMLTGGCGSDPSGPNEYK